ncbi:hypothetical protein SDRG_17234 [Saprolegnia diclina VS20]|uniref:Uncharacterized protein n=1 Tax=Saprolegnia diclina (strain VS20) TaxID=1156394 RepID=T0QYP4_SAPDV|nr:hypothetical protein SDRG_17234 [Saprolegnia diclina VS20]EQC24873.1 hypothetical protein SDRG_17234 [Saprolegnia diclina VS20]|eukprot:XP_008621696.1 hypothetical protein SDRG_17234 [Saprolegnia diclina VS20]
MSSNTVWSNAPALTRTHCAAMAVTTTVTVAPITSGRRAVLVFHLVYASPGDSPQSLINQSINALRGLAAKLRHKHNVLNYVLERDGIDVLSPGDARFAKALVASGAYDAVLVEYTRHCCHHVSASNYKLLPDTALPLSLAESVLTMSPEVRSGRETTGLDYCSLVFWLKAHRHRVVSLLPALKYAVHGHRRSCSVDELSSTLDGLPFDDEDALLGQASPAALLEALLPRFADEKEQGTHCYTDSVVACFKALLRLGRMDLLQRFLGMYLCVDDEYARDTAVGRWIHRCLQVFGWEPLASALYSVAQDPVCPPFIQRFAAECITEMWAIVAEGMPLFTDSGVTPWVNGVVVDICRHSLQLEVHAVTVSVTDRWLYNRLPDLIVAKVATYLGPANHMQRLIDMNVICLIEDLAPGVVALLEQGYDAVAHRYIPSVCKGVRSPSDNVTYLVEVVYNLLVVAALEGGSMWRDTLDCCGRELGLARDGTDR